MLMLVVLRLSIGWHFFKEGVEKYRNPEFSSAAFLSQAKGPLAENYHELAGGGLHDWDRLMAVPLIDRPPTEEESEARAAWEKEQAEKAKQAAEAQDAAIAEALAKKQHAGKDAGDGDAEDGDAENDPQLTEEERAAIERKYRANIEFPPDAPYRKWAEQVAADRHERVQFWIDKVRLSEQQQALADDLYYARKQQLADYLAENEAEIATYRHELARLDDLESNPAADDAPFVQQRISAKKNEAAGMATAWLSDVRQFEQSFHDDLWSKLKLSNEQRAMARGMDPPRKTVDMVVTYLTLGVGMCLILGLFTRLASVAGAVFLFSVIATQPPWIAGAVPTYYQSVEMIALLTLATTAVGRWAGLDYFTHALFSRCCTGGGN